MYTLAYFFLFIFLKVFHHLKVYGKENAPKKEPFIVVSNHTSYYDPTVLLTAIWPRKIRFMAKIELFKNPIMGFFFKSLGVFPVNREKIDRKSLQTALGILGDNGVVGLFPEGRRVKSKEERQVFRGAAYLAFKSKAVVLPVGINGTQNIMKDGSVLPRLARIKLYIGKPLKFEGNNEAHLAAFSGKIIEEIDKLKIVGSKQ